MKRNRQWRKRLAAIALLFSLLLPTIGGGAALAAEAVYDATAAIDGTDAEGNRTVALYYDDLVMRGNSAKLDSFLEIGKGQKMADGSYLELQLSYSPSIVPESSSVTVMIDDIPLGVIPLDSKEAKNKTARLDLSGLELGPGYHKVSLLASLRIASEQICEDPENERLWLVAQKTSRAVLKLSPIYDQADLSWYPSPFIERGGTNPLQAILIVPNALGQAEFAAAARLSQFIAEQTPSGQLLIPIYTESDVTDAMLNSRNAIWIGSADKWKTSGLKLSEAAAKTADRPLQSQGMIVEMKSPWNEARTHLLISGNDEQLNSAADLLTTESLYRQLQGHTLALSAPASSDEKEEIVKPGEPYSVTLRQLGYERLKTESVLHGSSQFDYTIPTDLDWGDNARLRLNYSHSKSIVFQKSVMTVKVNGTPVESVGLTARTSSGGTLDVPVDPSILGTGRKMNVEVGFQFANPAAEQNGDQNYGCVDTFLGDWAVVDGDSELIFTPKQRETAYLQSLPFPFVKGKRWEQTSFVAPAMGSRELQLAMTLIGKMGASGPEASGLRMELTSAPGWEDRVRNRHIVYIGTASGIPPSLNGFQNSYVRFTGDTVISHSPLVRLLESLSRNVAVLQLTSSPLSAEHRLLLLVATAPDRLGIIGETLANPEESVKLTSRLAIIDNKGAVFAFPDTQDPVVRHTAASTSNARWTNASISGLTFAAVLAAVGFIIAFAVIWGYRKAK
ncbi:MAG: cellulose biosynthesis cyclic di-GMP-binding regulatory protein BcsB [Paenibacillus sp.]|jgi:hypothetical protein|nr:cellulose biosynthesis cyclic di-GMP-binding regulatory protein BcsB [Paenibacillus sp.]